MTTQNTILDKKKDSNQEQFQNLLDYNTKHLEFLKKKYEKASIFNTETSEDYIKLDEEKDLLRFKQKQMEKLADNISKNKRRTKNESFKNINHVLMPVGINVGIGYNQPSKNHHFKIQDIKSTISEVKPNKPIDIIQIMKPSTIFSSEKSPASNKINKEEMEEKLSKIMRLKEKAALLEGYRKQINFENRKEISQKISNETPISNSKFDENIQSQKKECIQQDNIIPVMISDRYSKIELPKKINNLKSEFLSGKNLDNNVVNKINSENTRNEETEKIYDRLNLISLGMKDAAVEIHPIAQKLKIKINPLDNSKFQNKNSTNNEDSKIEDQNPSIKHSTNPLFQPIPQLKDDDVSKSMSKGSHDSMYKFDKGQVEDKDDSNDNNSEMKPKLQYMKEYQNHKESSQIERKNSKGSLENSKRAPTPLFKNNIPYIKKLNLEFTKIKSNSSKVLNQRYPEPVTNQPKTHSAKEKLSQKRTKPKMKKYKTFEIGAAKKDKKNSWLKNEKKVKEDPQKREFTGNEKVHNGKYNDRFEEEIVDKKSDTSRKSRQSSDKSRTEEELLHRDEIIIKTTDRNQLENTGIQMIGLENEDSIRSFVDLENKCINSQDNNDEIIVDSKDNLWDHYLDKESWLKDKISPSDISKMKKIELPNSNKKTESKQDLWRVENPIEWKKVNSENISEHKNESDEKNNVIDKKWDSFGTTIWKDEGIVHQDVVPTNNKFHELIINIEDCKDSPKLPHDDTIDAKKQEPDIEKHFINKNINKDLVFKTYSPIVIAETVSPNRSSFHLTAGLSNDGDDSGENLTFILEEKLNDENNIELLKKDVKSIGINVDTLELSKLSKEQDDPIENIKAKFHYSGLETIPENTGIKSKKDLSRNSFNNSSKKLIPVLEKSSSQKNLKFSEKISSNVQLNINLQPSSKFSTVQLKNSVNRVVSKNLYPVVKKKPLKIKSKSLFERKPTTDISVAIKRFLKQTRRESEEKQKEFSQFANEKRKQFYYAKERHITTSSAPLSPRRQLRNIICQSSGPGRRSVPNIKSLNNSQNKAFSSH